MGVRPIMPIDMSVAGIGRVFGKWLSSRKDEAPGFDTFGSDQSVGQLQRTVFAGPRRRTTSRHRWASRWTCVVVTTRARCRC